MSWTFIVPNIIIAICYWWIPINGLFYWRTHRGGLGKHTKLLLWYLAFIFSCGLTRFVSTFNLTSFHLFFLYLTAALSCRAAWSTRPFIQDVVKLPSREELHDAINNYSAEKLKREADLAMRLETIKSQEASIARLKEIIKTRMWLDDREQALQELSTMLERIRA